MRLNAFILALCVCVQYARAASIGPQQTKLDAIDNVDLDNVDIPNVEQEDFVPKNAVSEDIPVNVVEEQVVNENSNDYIPNNDDSNVSVKRIEVDLQNPGPPQRQEHETQNPESYGENEKFTFAIKHSIDNAKSVFNEGLQSLSNSFKSLLSPDENLPLIQSNIKNLKETFTNEIDKINNTIKAQFKPEPIPSDQSSKTSLELESRLKQLENNFESGINTISEGIELYAIIKEENEAEKAIAGKSDFKDDQTDPNNSNTSPPSSGFPSFIFNDLFQQMYNNIINGFSNFLHQNNTTSSTQGQTQQTAQGVQSDTPASSTTQTQSQQWPSQLFPYWNNYIRPIHNTIQQGPQNVQSTVQNPVQNTVVQQVPQFSIPSALQNIYNYFNNNKQSQTNTTSTTTAKPSDCGSSKKPVSDVLEQTDNVVPDSIQSDVRAPPREQPQQAQSVQANPGLIQQQQIQPGPIQQILQNNPLIKGIQSAVQRIQGVPNPETPREEVVQKETKNKNENDSKGHYGGNRPNVVTNQGDNNDSGRVEDKIEKEKVQEVSTLEEVVEEKIKPEQLEGAVVSDKTE